MAIITAKERLVMRIVYDLVGQNCGVGQKHCGVISEDDIWERLPVKTYFKFLHKKTNMPDAKVGKIFVKDKPIAKEQIRGILNSLSIAQYFELTKAVSAPIESIDDDDKKKKKKHKGEQEEQVRLEQKPQPKEKFIIELQDKGKAFLREEQDRIRGLMIKIVSTILFTILTFTVTMILRAIFY